MCLSHPRITATFYVEYPVTTLILKLGSALPIALEVDFWLSFSYRSGYRSGPRPRNRKCACLRIKETPFLAVYGWLHMTTGWPGMISTMAVLLRVSTPCRTLCNMSIMTALDGEILVIGLCEESVKWYQQKCLIYKRFWLSVYARGQKKSISNSKVSTIVHCAGPIKIEKASTSTST